LSRLSGIARSRIYDVLRGLIKKGIVFEIEQGQYVPLPFDELKKRLRSQFETNLSILEEKLQDVSAETEYEYLITLKGYDTVLNKALDMVRSAKKELYLRLFPNTYARMEKRVKKAAHRGVGIRLVGMGHIPLSYEHQVVHPDADRLIEKIGGESIDIIADKSEALVGIFETGRIDLSPVIWSRNRWFVTANRDSLRHDFYHYFLHQIYECKKELTEREKAIYEFIKRDE
jgi:sugar-specific transcriptional regulator TrmB